MSKQLVKNCRIRRWTRTFHPYIWQSRMNISFRKYPFWEFDSFDSNHFFQISKRHIFQRNRSVCRINERLFLLETVIQQRAADHLRRLSQKRIASVEWRLGRIFPPDQLYFTRVASAMPVSPPSENYFSKIVVAARARDFWRVTKVVLRTRWHANHLCGNAIPKPKDTGTSGGGISSRKFRPRRISRSIFFPFFLLLPFVS